MTAPPRPPRDVSVYFYRDYIFALWDYTEWLEQQLELCEAKLEAGREPLPWGDLD